MKVRIICLIVLIVSSIFIPNASSVQENSFLISQSLKNTPLPQAIPAQSPISLPASSPSIDTQIVIDIPVIAVLNGPKADILNNERALILDVKQGTQINYNFLITDKDPNQKVVPKALYLPQDATFKLLGTDTIINDNLEDKSFPYPMKAIFSWKPTQLNLGFNLVIFQATNSLNLRDRVSVYFYVHP